jgi:CheY-like chemotaxis protein
MPAEVVARAFEPFFTTKEVGRGTGLGLSMVYGFVKQSGGYVMIYSEPGVGTAVKLYLPKADAVSAAAPEEPSAPPLLPTGSETILLVEDDRLVRVNTETQLARLGYTVVSADNAADAVAKVAAGLNPTLLFTDVVMPGRLNGFELAQQLRGRLPGLKVLFTSGYTQGATLLPDGVSAGNFLGKPFRRHDLAVKIREALDKPAA